ncbi:MFS transporter [Pengzhenrongella frigida]|uniref:MFS transporter n=1 Tax=Pengzhenrongella frigida TaxID=1259133 RepID=UPI001F5DE119|nr:MFS transporter [Cellulomonas sp. HLT2-17]
MHRPYSEILKTPGSLAFSAAGVLARLPISMVGIGIVLMVSAIYDSYGLAGRISAVYVIANAVCGPQLARYVDRYGQARIMRPAIAVAVVGIAALVLVASAQAHPVWLYATAIVAGVPAGSFGSLVRARWSYVLHDPRQLHTAYSLESALDEAVFVIGPVLATVLATSVAPSAGLIVPMVALIVGGYLFLSLHRTEPPAYQAVLAASQTVPAAPGVPGAQTDSLGTAAQPAPRRTRARSVLRSPGMLVLAIVFVAMGGIFGATDVSTVAFAQEQGSKASAGFVLASFALGSMISGLGYGARHWLTPLWKRFAIGMVALAFGVSLFFLVNSIPMLALVMFVTGFAIAPTLINGNGLVQYFVPPERLTEGLTWVGTTLGIGVSFGSSIAGMLIDRQGSRGGFAVVAFCGGFAVLATLASLRALRAGNPAVVVVGP